jgi:hypothetical protein
VVVLAVFTFSDAVDPRYLLPVMPAFAALVAAGIGVLDGPGLPFTSRAARWLLLPMAAAGLLLAVPEAFVLLQVGSGIALAALVLGVAAWVLAALLGWRRPRFAPHILAAMPVLAAALRPRTPVVLPDRGIPFAAAAGSPGRAGRQRAFVGDIHIASEIRLAVGMAEPFTEYDRVGEALTAAAAWCLPRSRGRAAT